MKDMEKKIIVNDGRRMEFFGYVNDGVMQVTHVVDPSRSVMHEFARPGFASSDDDFNGRYRLVARKRAKAKHGIGQCLAFKKYQCKLEMVADDDGDNAIEVTAGDRDITDIFYTKHWGPVCEQESAS